MTKKEIEIAVKLAKANGEESARKFYPTLVQHLINEQYSLYDEVALLRQRSTKKAEFAEYNSYCEECKARAKEMLGLE